MAQQPSQDLLAQIEALTQGFNQNARLGSLSPELLAYLAGQQGEAANGGLLRGFTLPDGRRISQYGQYALADANASPDAQSLSTDPSRVNWNAGPVDFMLNTDLSNKAAMFDPGSGQFLGYEQREDGSSYRDFLTAAAMILGGYYGGTYLSELGAAGAGTAEGVGGAAATGGGTGGLGATDWATWAANEGSGALAGSGYTGTAFNAGELAAGAAGSAGSAGATGGTNWADWAANEGSNALSGSGYAGADFMAGEAAAAGGGMNAAQKLAAEEAARKAAQQGGSNGGNSAATDAATKAATKGLMDYFTDGTIDYTKLATGLLGAYAGYEGGKDKTNSTQVEPWKPAQPYLEGLLREGSGLFDQYKKQPFSPAEQAGYGNYGNVLDYINGNAGGLLDGFQANASGANQFVRGQPRTLLGSSYDPATSPVAWAPQRFGNFGTGRK